MKIFQNTEITAEEDLLDDLLTPQEGPMAYQLVGEVKAHQGNDGYRV